MAKRLIIEDPVDNERWLVSYADFLMLLMAFFIVMYSISHVSESKYRVLSSTLTKAFNIDPGDLPALEVAPIGELPQANPDSHIKLPEQALAGTQGQQGTQFDGVVPDEFEVITERLDSAFSELITQNKISVKGNEEWLQIELSAGLLFEGGTAELTTEAELIINQVAQTLYDNEQAIRVEGFTDNIPISTDYFPSNWELSSARAAAVVQILVEIGFDPAKLAAVGYGQYQPKASNSTLEGRKLNRRVVLMVSRTKEIRPNFESSSDALDVMAYQTEVQSAKEEEKKDDTGVSGVKKIRLKGGGVLFTSGDRDVDEDYDR